MQGLTCPSGEKTVKAANAASISKKDFLGVADDGWLTSVV